MALGIKKGDNVWTSPITFVASANCALYCGANIDFVDIDPYNFNINIDELKKKLAVAKKNKVLPKVLIVVHFAGLPCEMKLIKKLSLEYKFKIIEDASHAIGASYLNGKIGSNKYSDITIFSFHPVKIITTGEGGMVLTNNKKTASLIENLRSHGIVRNKPKKNVSKLFFYSQINLGFNYRMTDIQAALGISQLRKINSFIKERNKLARNYKKLLSKNSCISYQKNSLKNTVSSYHLFVIRLRSKKYSQVQAFNFMKKNGINVNLHYIPVYLHPYYKNLGFKSGLCPEAEQYFKETMTLPLYPGLKYSDQFKISQLLNSIC
jgi:dTDP-4-amino-4,6-dideoxygalactose transaminase